MKRSRYIRDLLFILFAIYYAQGTFYTQGSIVAQGSLAIILIISAFYFIKTLFETNNKSNFYKAWTVFILINATGFVFSANIGHPNHISMFKGILTTSLSLYPFYYFAQNGLLKSKHLLRFFVVMTPITIYRYSFYANMIFAERLSSNTDIVNNIGYSFVALIPFVFIFKKKRIYAIVSIMILMFFIIQSGKRGALIAGMIGLIGFIYFQLRTVEKKNRYRSYLIVFIGVLALSYFVYDVFQNNEFIIARMQRIGDEGGSSGRDIIFSNIFNAWLNSDNMFNLLFGFGFAASLNLSGRGNYAHNDWLEILSNFGIIGIFIYSFLFYTVIKYISNKEWDTDKRILLLTIVLIWIMNTLVVNSYMSMNGYIQSMFLAYLIGSNSKSIE